MSTARAGLARSNIRRRVMIGAGALLAPIVLASTSDATADAVVPSPATIDANITENSVRGEGWADSNGDVDVTVFDSFGGSSIGKWTVSPSGDSFEIDRFQLGAVHLAPGMAVEAADADGSPAVTKTLVVADLSIESMSATTDVITGVAPADALGRNELEIELLEHYDDGAVVGDLTVSPDVTDGSWTADFSGTGIHIDSGVDVYLAEYDPGAPGLADGDRTVVSRMPRIGASRNWVGGDRWYVEGNITVEVFSDPNDIPGSLIGDLVITPDPEGRWLAELDAFVPPIELVPGTAIRATDDNDPTLVKFMIIDEATVGDADPDMKTVRGTAPPNIEVDVVVFDDSDSEVDRVQAQTDSSGAYTATFTNDFVISQTNHVAFAEYDPVGAGGVDMDATVEFFTPPRYTGLTPFRLLDTRPAPSLNTGPFDTPWGPDTTRSIKVTGGDVPNTATAVAVNVTAVRPTELSFLTIFPKGADMPTAASLNFAAGTVRNDLVIAKVGDGGMIDIYNELGSVDLVIDVVGFYAPNVGDGYVGFAPFRLIDTRPAPSLNTGPFDTPWGPDTTRSIKVTGGDVPNTATAVAVNVTAVRPTALSFLTVFPTGAAMPTAASLNYGAGVVRNDLVIAKVGDGGMIDLYNESGSVDLVIDVVGYVASEAPDGYFGLTPFRLIDSRPAPGLNTGPFSTPWGVDDTRTVQLSSDKVPEEAIAVAVHVTAVRPSELSFLTVYPTGQGMPTAASLNYAADVVRNDLVIANLGSDGNVEFYNELGNVDLVIDVVGYYRS